MIGEIFLALFSIFVFFLILCATIGNRLQLFSNERLQEFRLLRIAIVRWLMYACIGFVWILAKVHFPSTEIFVIYGWDNRMGYVLRAAYWKARVRELGKDVMIDIGAKAIGWRLISIGDNSWIDRNVILETGSINMEKYMVHVKKTASEVNQGELKIGKGCHISKNVVIQSYGGVFIGDFSGIASGAKIYSLSHHYKNVESDNEKVYKFTPCAPPEDQSLIQGAVVLEGNNAVGLNSVILPGVRIGKNSWVGVCSYVVEDIPSNSISSGCPAKVKKTFHKKDGAE
jgi:acetyltransferase-like isoleucine patch superfamily enzyme